MKYIYKLSNPKNMIYIGQTANYIKRKHNYKYLRCKSQTKLYYSLKKYGWNNHLFEIIETVEDHLANTREQYYISLYNSFESGLNLTIGGDCGAISQVTKNKISKALMSSNNIKARIVNQYSLNGELITVWKAMKDIERELGYFTSAISQGIKNKRPIYGFIWSFGEYYIPRQIKNVGIKSKKVYQYDLNGIFLNEFESISEAAHFTNIDRNTIKRSINNTSNSRKYIWTLDRM